jgi:hypothetical protein
MAMVDEKEKVFRAIIRIAVYWMEEGYGDGKIQCEKENVEMEMASETTRKI